MKEVVYKLDAPIDGVEELVLFAPTRKHLKFAFAVKQAFMSAAFEMAEKMGDKTETKDADSDTVLEGSEMIAALYSGSADVGDLIERFILNCTDSTMCQMQGGNIPKDFWEKVPMVDVEGLFAEFLGNFIII